MAIYTRICEDETGKIGTEQVIHQGHQTAPRLGDSRMLLNVAIKPLGITIEPPLLISEEERMETGPAKK